MPGKKKKKEEKTLSEYFRIWIAVRPFGHFHVMFHVVRIGIGDQHKDP